MNVKLAPPSREPAERISKLSHHRLIASIAIASIACSETPTSTPEYVQTQQGFELETSCTIAGVSTLGSRAGAESAGQVSGRGGGLQAADIETMDEQWARIAEVVPGGFAGYYLGRDGRFVVRLVRPEEREAALRELERLLGGAIDFTGAHVLKADYDFAELKRYYDRLIVILDFDVVAMSDINEELNRIVLGVIDEQGRQRIAREVTALDDVPCEVVMIELAEPAIPL